MEQELNQEGAAREPAREETSTPASTVASIDEKATSEKVRTEDEFRKLQSLKDKSAAEADSYKQHLQSVQGEMQQLQYQVDQQKLEAQRREIEGLADDPDAQSRLRKLHQREEGARRYEEYLGDKDRGLTAKRNQAKALAKEYNFSDPDDELLNAETPREMELMAKLKGKEPVATQPPKDPFDPDRGISDAGGEDDNAFMRTYSEGKSDDHVRAQKILQKLK